MLLDYLSLAGGLVALIFAGDLLVRGSVSVAQKLGIPNLVIGLTIVAFGTSAPELVISLGAGLEGAGGIAIGNVVGSNIANVLLVLGMPALIAATPCGENGATRNAIFMVFVSGVFIALCYLGTLNWVASIVLLALLALFLLDSARVTLCHRREMKNSEAKACSLSSPDTELEDVDGVPENTLLAAVYIVIGLIGLPIGAHFSIEGATGIASAWGVSDAVIALTVIALGTSLPELATTVMAAIRQQGAVAIGNVIGSNIFNLLAIIGITTAIVPLEVPREILNFDVWVMLACAVLLLGLANWRICLGKATGAVLCICYGLYIYAVYCMGLAS
ncbi:calcium/sodium antiporter [Roseibium limicola]|uniref:Calcium/sodium antiporter n=1 Tax=Roseibium limicola TaxID=2816037 RepID=A0A939EKC2_9HYPH|nr:calcium/sodium antiporter [Roseibium limicola]MBO0343815.1 calcium/sodium antiporter [Roseibium limicola]